MEGVHYGGVYVLSGKVRQPSLCGWVGGWVGEWVGRMVGVGITLV